MSMVSRIGGLFLKSVNQNRERLLPNLGRGPAIAAVTRTFLSMLVGPRLIVPIMVQANHQRKLING